MATSHCKFLLRRDYLISQIQFPSHILWDESVTISHFTNPDSHPHFVTVLEAPGSITPTSNITPSIKSGAQTADVLTLDLVLILVKVGLTSGPREGRTACFPNWKYFPIPPRLTLLLISLKCKVNYISYQNESVWEVARSHTGGSHSHPLSQGCCKPFGGADLYGNWSKTTSPIWLLGGRPHFSKPGPLSTWHGKVLS